MFFVDLTVLALSGCIFFVYLYLCVVYYCHRNQFTASSILQANLVICNLITAYYMTGAAFAQAFEETPDHTSGWDMTLSSLSVTSWALVVAFWYQSKEEQDGDKLDKKSDVSIVTSYIIICILWSYFALLVLVHWLGIYGWTFTTHESHGWLFFFLVPFLLPWILQAVLIYPTLVATYTSLNAGDFKLLDTNQPPPTILSTLFFCSSAAAIFAALTTRILFPNEELTCFLDEALLSVVCITWMNCSVFPLLMTCSESCEVAPTKMEVDAVIDSGVRYLSGVVRERVVVVKMTERKVKMEKDLEKDQNEPDV
eukprot:sb/3467089/